MRRPRLGTILLLLLLLAALPAQAVEPINKTWRGLALKGYDAVAYFTDGEPTPGDSEITFAWNGATWRFATVEHRDRFAAEPKKYAPQYGGYCAKAVSDGTTADIDPTAWRIVGGKLYLNYSAKVQQVWERDIPRRIAQADEYWPKLLGAQGR